ncbi:MAG: hypothetical protein V3V19_11255 [Cocleimonas sp.]
MSEEILIDNDGNIAISKSETKIVNRRQFLSELADSKIRYLARIQKVQAEIDELQQSLSDENIEITKLYEIIIPGMTTEEKDQIIKDDLELNNKLHKAFPNQFDEVVRKITATK